MQASNQSRPENAGYANALLFIFFCQIAQIIQVAPHSSSHPFRGYLSVVKGVSLWRDAIARVERTHNLRPSTPDHFSTCCHHSQLAHIDFDDGSFREHAQLGVHGILGVLYNSDGQEFQAFALRWKRSHGHTFFTDIMGSCTVTFNSGCVTCAFLYRNPIGRMNRSYLTGRRVKSGPTRKWHVSTSSAPWCSGEV